MKILVINPNTSEHMTEDVRKTVERVKSSDVQVDVVHPDFGSESLESFYDYQLAAFGMFRSFGKKLDEYDGVLVACYGDPGLYGMKEICKCPVIGIAEGSIALANLLGGKFAILAASKKAIPMMTNMVQQYGQNDRCAGVYALNMSVLDAEEDKEKSIATLIEVGRKAMENGAEVLIPGCAGLTGISEPVEKELGITVLDPVGSSYSVLETIVKQRLKISRAGLYQEPPVKHIAREDLLG